VVLSYLLRHHVELPLGLSWTTWVVNVAVLLALTIPLAMASSTYVEIPFQAMAKSWAVARAARIAERRTAAPIALPAAPAYRRVPRRVVAAALVGCISGAGAALAVGHDASATGFARVVTTNRPAIILPAKARVATLLHDPRPIVAFGDSLTESYGVPPDQSYPAVLGRLLGEQVISRGYSGKMAFQAQAFLPDVLAVNPKLVIIEFGTNEANTGRPISVAIAGLEGLLNVFDAHHIASVLVGTRVDSTHLGNLVPPGWATYAGDWDDALRALAQRHHVGVVTNVLDGLTTQPDRYHPLAAGYATVAQRVMEAVRSVEASG
jgi:acyl-CoA thioesterase-1